MLISLKSSCTDDIIVVVVIVTINYGIDQGSTTLLEKKKQRKNFVNVFDVWSALPKCRWQSFLLLLSEDKLQAM